MSGGRVFGRLVGLLRTAILDLAEYLARAPHERPDAEPESFHIMRISAFVLIVAAAALYMTPTLVGRWNEMSSAPFSVAFNDSRWKVIVPGVSRNDEICSGPRLQGDCPGSPAYSFDGRRVISRTDSRHAEIVRELGATPFWEVYDLTSEEALQAAAEGANHLFIGVINGHYRIYFNGTLLRSSANFPESSLVSATIPLVQLSQPARIAIWIKNDSESAFPDIFQAALFRATGFLSTSSLDNMLSLRNLVSENQHWLLAFGYFLVSALFFSLWLATPRKRELFFFALYGITLALLSLRLPVSYYLAVPRANSYRLELILTASEAATAFAVGCAMARIRREVIVSGVAILGAILVLAWRSAKVGPDFLAISSNFSIYIVPAAYLISSLICLVQWYWVHVQISARRNYWFSSRALRLLGYSTVSCALGLVYASQAKWAASPAHMFTIQRVTPVLGFMFTALILLREFRDQSQQMDYTPVSKYHRMTPLPRAVTGFVLEIDLKNSEVLFRAAAGEADQNILVQAFVDAWMVLVTAAGGEIIAYQGDMIRGFFDSELPQGRKSVDTAMTILLAVDRMANVMESKASDLKSRTGIDVAKLMRRPAFRAALSFGAIRPTLLGNGRQRIAAWMNADESHLLLKTTRLLEAEKAILKDDERFKDESPCTLVVDEEALPKEVTERLSELATELGLRLRQRCDVFLREKNSRPPRFTLMAWVAVDEKKRKPSRAA